MNAEQMRRELFSGKNHRKPTVHLPIKNQTPKTVSFRVGTNGDSVEIQFSVEVSRVAFSPAQAAQIGQLLIHYAHVIGEAREKGDKGEAEKETDGGNV